MTDRTRLVCFTLIPNGVPGIEERLMVLHHAGVRGGHFTLERFVALTATNPARSFGLGRVKGSVAPGHDADLTLWDLERPRTITAQAQPSAVDHSLYEGMEVRGTPVTVLVRGQMVVDQGELVAERGGGQFLYRQRIRAPPGMRLPKCRLRGDHGTATAPGQSATARMTPR